MVICSHHVSSVPHCLDEPYGGQQEMGQVLDGFWAHHDHHRADAGPNHDQRLAKGEVEEINPAPDKREKHREHGY